MNINKKLIKGTAITVAAVTVIATTGFQMVHAANGDKVTTSGNVIQVANNNNVTLSASDIDANAYKDETVYVIADPTGATQKIIVSDWLKNTNGSLGLSDISNLSDITNVKGLETFEADKSALTWNANGNDIYYQGTANAQLPVNVKVTYTLDGKEISPEELVGKSGRLTVRYEYTNQLKQTVDINGKEEEIYTPIMMLTGSILQTEKYKNIEVTNGKVISDGNNQIVVGFSLPGMTDSLKMTDGKVKVPEYFEYTADVTDYEVGASVSVGLTNLFSDMNINDEEFSVEDIQKKIDELVDGVDQLMDGSSKLYDGLVELQAKASGDFSDGVNTLASSLTKLNDAFSQLDQGVAKLDQGASSLKDGATTLKGGLGSAKDGMDQIVSNYPQVKDGATKLADGIQNVASGADSLKTNLENVNATYGKLSETVSNDEALIAALKQVNAQYKDQTIAGIIAKLEANTAGQKQIADGLADAGSKLVTGSASISQGANALQAGANTLKDGIGTLSEGSKKVQGALGQLYTGSASLEDGASKLALGTGSLKNSVKELKNAGGQLVDGSNKLVDATDQFVDGIGQLKDGSGELKDGIKKLNDEGISQITDLVNDDLSDLIERFKAVVDAGKSYNNFSGIGEGMDGSVKFVIKYE